VFPKNKPERADLIDAVAFQSSDEAPNPLPAKAMMPIARSASQLVKDKARLRPPEDADIAARVTEARARGVDVVEVTVDVELIRGARGIRGTRITVELILQKIAAGQSIDQILGDYPHLTREGIVAALEFAVESVRVTTLYPLPSDKASA